MSSQFLGARASNAGDDFHELWAARHAISLLANDDGLGAITVEGVGAEDEATADARAWDGVDCALYYGGVDCPSASRIVIEQLKYSAASPEAPWTLARSTYAKRAGQAVIGKLAKAWFAAKSLAKDGVPVNAVLVSNQPVDTDLTSCVSRIVAAGGATTWASGTDEYRFAAACGLKEPELSQFCASLRFDSGAGSRFAAEEKLLTAVARWAESDIKFGVMRLREFIRNRMRPETAGQVITRDSVLLHFGDLTGETLFPAPATLSRIENPVRRASVGLVSEALARGDQFVALQGQGGIGKTTALQQIERELPADSLMVVYDCYGGGTYLDPSTLRHRPRDFYVQLTNEVATRLQLTLAHPETEQAKRNGSSAPPRCIEQQRFSSSWLPTASHWSRRHRKVGEPSGGRLRRKSSRFSWPHEKVGRRLLLQSRPARRRMAPMATKDVAGGPELFVMRASPDPRCSDRVHSPTHLCNGPQRGLPSLC